MESNSEAMRIHISTDTFQLLQVRLVERGWRVGSRGGWVLMITVRIERVGIRCENELFAVFSRRPPDSSDTIVANTDTYAAKVWALSIVQEPFSVAPCDLIRSIRNKQMGGRLIRRAPGWVTIAAALH
jgi:hypothetical protein